MSEERKPTKETQRKSRAPARWAIPALTALVVVLLGVVIWLTARTGALQRLGAGTSSKATFWANPARVEE